MQGLGGQIVATKTFSNSSIWIGRGIDIGDYTTQLFEKWRNPPWNEANSYRGLALKMDGLEDYFAFPIGEASAYFQGQNGY